MPPSDLISWFITITSMFSGDRRRAKGRKLIIFGLSKWSRFGSSPGQVEKLKGEQHYANHHTLCSVP